MSARQFPSRRAFLGGAAAGGVALAGASMLARREWLRRRAPRGLQSPPEDAILQALREEFSDLAWEPGVDAEFVGAFKASPVYANLASMDEIKKLFLLSTNFVQSRGNPAAPLKFTTLYSPYESPCYNPFAEAVPDQGAPAANWE
jgi:hypothetical protein